MKNKSLIAITLSAVMLVSMLASCTNVKKSSKEVKEDDPWFESTRFDIDSEIPSGALTDYSQISVSNDKIYYTYLYTTNMFGSTHTCMDTYDLDGTKLDHVELIYPDEGAIYRVFHISPDSDSDAIEAIVLLNNGGKTDCAYLTVDPETGKTSDVRYLFGDKAKAVRKPSSNINSVTRLGDYTIAVLDYGVSVFSYQIMLFKDTEFITECDLSTVNLRYLLDGFSINESEGLLYMSGLEEADVVTLAFDLNYGTLKDKSVYQDTGENEVNYAEYSPTTDGNLCKIDSLGNITRLDVTTMTPQTVVDTNWYTPYFNPPGNNWYGANTGVVSCSDDTVVLMDTERKTYNQLLLEANVQESITVLKKADKNPHAGKEIIEIALPLDSGISVYLARSIYEFNKTDNEYLIRVWDKYKTGFTLSRVIGNIDQDEEQVYQMIQDLKGEEAPDLVIGIQKNYAMRDDIFMDLTGFLDQEVLDKQYANIIEAGTIDGKLYFLPVTLEIEGLVTNTDLLEEGAVGINFEDFDKLVEEDMDGFSPYDYTNSLYCNKCDFVLSCLDSKSAIEGETIEFGTDQFFSAVEYANENFIYFDADSIPEDYLFDTGRNIGECRYARIGSFIDYLDNCYGSEGDYAIIGTPSVDASGPRFRALETISVAAETDVTDGCKKFINYLFSGAAFENSDCEFWQIVTNKEIMAKNVETLSQNNNEAFDKLMDSINSGVEIVPGDVFLAYGGKTATDAMRDNFFDSLSSISTYYYDDKVITGFIMEELAPYFSGDRSLDDVVTYINDRVTKYVREM